jgi:hypothetical protein
MTVRTATKSVTFCHPFSLKGADGLQPAGTYAVETEEEAVPALSFLAYRRPSPSDGLVYSIRRRCRTAGGHDRSSGPRSGSGTRPRLNKPDELLRPSDRLVCVFVLAVFGLERSTICR